MLSCNVNPADAFNFIKGLRQASKPERQDEQLFAAAVFYGEQGRTAEAASTVLRVNRVDCTKQAISMRRPKNSRTAPALSQKVEAARAIGEVGNRQLAKRRLETLASQAHASWETSAEAEALAAVGSLTRAFTLVSRQMSGNGRLAGDPICYFGEYDRWCWSTA